MTLFKLLIVLIIRWLYVRFNKYLVLEVRRHIHNSLKINLKFISLVFIIRSN